MLSGFPWYTGADPAIIPSGEFDYQTVVTQELAHLIGLDHDGKKYKKDTEVALNTDQRSVMRGSLAPGIVRRFMSTHDQELLLHLYGPGQEATGGGGGGGGGGRPRCHPVRGCGSFVSATVAVPEPGLAVMMVTLGGLALMRRS